MATELKTKKPAAKSTEKAVKKPAALAAAPAASVAEVDPRNALQKRRTMVGTVVSDKMQKTIVVKVDRRVRHLAYKKYIMKSRRFKAHDEKNEAKVGDLVVLVESRPMSRDKRWAMQSIMRRAAQAIEANI